MRFSSLGLCFLVGHANDLKSQFEEFKIKFERNYESAEEELHRFSIFVENAARVEQMKIMDPDTEQSIISPLADMSSDEFSARNTLRVSHEELENAKKNSIKVVMKDPLPEKFDWRDQGAVTPVKNQGQCGSCWSFGTVANLEGNNFLTNGKLISLSEQQLVDCSTKDHGCGGGLPSWAYQDLMDSDNGLETEASYSYHARNMKCHENKSKEVVFVSSWQYVGVKHEDQIAAGMMKYGPLAIGLNAGPMQFYSGGISDPWMCDPKSIDHAVTLVGFGHGTSGWIHKTDKPFWIIKNSWGTQWGEKGFYRLVRGKGKCGMDTVVTTGIVKKDHGQEEWM